jgi:hypothetical protein
MNQPMRWRIIVLQAALVAVLGILAGFAFWGANFSHDMVHDQLAEQQIFFPKKGDANFSATEYPTLQKYAGQQLLDGPQAQAYANDYIGHHLKSVANGMTYSQASAASRLDPNNTELAGQVQTLFRGETLRGLLLNAYGWWTVGQYAFYAGLGIVLAAGVVFVGLLFEVWRWLAETRGEKAAPLGAPARA